MNLAAIWTLIVALIPALGAVLTSLYAIVKSTKIFNDIKETYDLSRISKKIDKQIVDNDKLCTEIKALYKLIYKYEKGVELSDEDVKNIINKHN